MAKENGAGTTRHRSRLRTHCARWTAPREEIFGLLIKTQQHLSAKEIYAALHPVHPEIGLTTVYRTLELLDKAGLARKVHTGDGQVRFEYKKGDHSDHHHHLICTHCGKILNYRDFEKEELDLVRKTEDILARKHGFLIRDHNIEFLGLCEDCRPGGKRSVIRHEETGPSSEK
jgi:Fur family ferric uptake transcriptional regulator